MGEIRMPLLRVRVVLPDDPAILTAFTAEQPVGRLLVIQGALGATMTSDIVVELPKDDGLGAMLCGGNCGATTCCSCHSGQRRMASVRSRAVPVPAATSRASSDA
jgi:hypothetical protein